MTIPIMRRLSLAAALSAAVIAQVAVAANAVTLPAPEGAAAVYASEVVGAPYTPTGIAANSPVVFTKPPLIAGISGHGAADTNGASR